ncbi:MAG: class I SAM-dependent methyltransferase [Deltaproteobacteria bacterium]|nr:class I SAM-dependent methyltransferase [Deltaproteobacteria bacterium]
MSQADRRKWDGRYRETGGPEFPPHEFVLRAEPVLPTRGCAFDVAGGVGNHALWLARRGLDVTLADISQVALDIARERAFAHGLALKLVELDFDVDPLPQGTWDVILCSYFLDRALYRTFAPALSASGLLLIMHPTVKTLERSPKPSREHLLNDGELLELVGDLDVLDYEEGWRGQSRHEARLLGRRRAGLTS